MLTSTSILGCAGANSEESPRALWIHSFQLCDGKNHIGSLKWVMEGVFTPRESAHTAVNQRAGCEIFISTPLCSSQLRPIYDRHTVSTEYTCKYFMHFLFVCLVLLLKISKEKKASEWFCLADLIWQLHIQMFIDFRGSKNALIGKLMIDETSIRLGWRIASTSIENMFPSLGQI